MRILYNLRFRLLLLQRKSMTKTIAEQIQLLKRGTAEIFTENELTEKLSDAVKIGKQLRIKLGHDPTSQDIFTGK